MSPRIQIRITEEHDRKIDEMCGHYGLTGPDLIRKMVDWFYATQPALIERFEYTEDGPVREMVVEQ